MNEREREYVKREKEIYKTLADERERRKIIHNVRVYLVREMRKTWGREYLWYLGGLITLDTVKS